MNRARAPRCKVVPAPPVLPTMRAFLTYLCLLIGLMSVGCGSGTYVTRGAVLSGSGPEREIDDDDIRKAFEARPQLGPSFRVAYFSLDPDKGAEVEALAKTIPGVTDVYAIPTILVTGEPRLGAVNPYGPSPSPEVVSLKKLRLLAARAHADVLLLVDSGHRVLVEPNGWVATSPLLLPVLFVPFLETTTESYLDAYWLDVRNGYLYGQTVSVRKEASDSHTIYSDPSEEVLKAQWVELMNETRTRLAEVVAAGQRPPSEVASGALPGPLPTPPAPPATPTPSPVSGTTSAPGGGTALPAAPPPP